jgi:hypothetical protein
MIPTVAINGGLGNQLFQWFFAHSINQNQQFQIDKIFDSYDFTGQLHYQLAGLEGSCNHVLNPACGKRLNKARRLVFSILNRSWNYSSLRVALRAIGYLRESPKKTDPQNMDEFSDRRIFYAYGYFQNVQTALQSSLLENELEPYISAITNELLSRLGLAENEYDLVHVRKYPIHEMRQVDIGNLSLEYYQDWIDKVSSKKLIVLCKDFREAEFLLNKYPDISILDDSHVNPWEAIALMSRAQKCLSSNSTLSWWGALLCKRNFGEAYLPSDWSYWGNVETAKLHFESCKIQISRWDIGKHDDPTCIDPRTGKSI